MCRRDRFCTPIGVAGYTGMVVSIAHRSGAVVQGNAILNPASGGCCCVQLGSNYNPYSSIGEQKRSRWTIALWVACHLGFECIDVVDSRVWTSTRMAHDVWRHDAVLIRNISGSYHSCWLADLCRRFCIQPLRHASTFLGSIGVE